jgi:hypothetical protein
VSWGSKKQPTVSQSSCESKYHAMDLAAANVKLFINLLQDLRVFLSLPLILLCNNKSLIFLVFNDITHKHSKHFDLDYHFVKE